MRFRSKFIAMPSTVEENMRFVESFFFSLLECVVQYYNGISTSIYSILLSIIGTNKDQILSKTFIGQLPKSYFSPYFKTVKRNETVNHNAIQFFIYSFDIFTTHNQFILKAFDFSFSVCSISSSFVLIIISKRKKNRRIVFNRENLSVNATRKSQKEHWRFVLIIFAIKNVQKSISYWMDCECVLVCMGNTIAIQFYSKANVWN